MRSYIEFGFTMQHRPGLLQRGGHQHTALAFSKFMIIISLFESVEKSYKHDVVVMWLGFVNAAPPPLFFRGNQAKRKLGTKFGEVRLHLTINFPQQPMPVASIIKFLQSFFFH